MQPELACGRNHSADYSGPLTLSQLTFCTHHTPLGPLGNVWRHLVVNTGNCYWHLVDRSQGCCKKHSKNVQDSPHWQIVIWPKMSIWLRMRHPELEYSTPREPLQNLGWSGSRKRTLIMKTTLKFPQEPYQICTRVFRTGEWNKWLTMPCGLRITNFALVSRWHQIPCIFYFILFFLLLY